MAHKQPIRCGLACGLLFLTANGALATAFQWPVDNPNPINNGYAAFNVISNNKHHAGLDLTSSTGSLIVRAAASGAVRIVPKETFSNENHGMGNVIIIDHNSGQGPFTLYAHLASFSAADGQLVAKGSQIGVMGNSGTGAAAGENIHLHFELKFRGVLGNLHDDLGPAWGYTVGHPNLYGYINPRPYLDYDLAAIPPRAIRSSANQIVRTGPDSGYTTVVTTVEANQLFAASTEHNGWYQVCLPSLDGPATGWIQAVPEAAAEIVRVNDPSGTTQGVDVRASASTSTTQLASVWHNQRFVKLAENASGTGCGTEWHQIAIAPTGSYNSGWVCGDYLVTETQNTASFGGLARDGETGSPIQGATVSWGNYTTSSAADGSYLFASVPCATRTLSVSKAGYAAYSELFTPLCLSSSVKNVSLAKAGTKFRMLTEVFSYVPGVPITIDAVLEDDSGRGIVGATVYASDSLSLNPQTRIIGTTGADGRIALSYSGALTQTLGSGAYPVVLAADKARTAFVINLEAPGDLFAANTLRLNAGVVGSPVFLTQDTLVFSPRVAGSTIPVLTENQVLDSAMKLARETSIWLAQHPVETLALGGAVVTCSSPEPVSKPVCAALVKFLISSAGRELGLAAGHAIINRAPDYTPEQRAQAHQFLDQLSVGISLLGLKPDGRLLTDLELFSTTWDTLTAAMEMVRSESGELIGLNLVGLGTGGQETRVVSCRLPPPSSSQSYLMTVIPALPELGYVSGVGMYPELANVTILAEPVPGFNFANWTEDGNIVTDSSSYSFVATSNRTLVANFSAVPPAPCLDANEPNDSSLAATTLIPPASVQGRICTATDVDWFKVHVTEPGPLTFQLTVPADNDYDLELYGPDTYYIKGSYNDVGAVETITHNALQTGWYYVRVYGYPPGNGSFNTSSSYTLTANSSSGAPTIVTPPQDRTVIEGASALFNVVAGGAAPLAYQWQRNGLNLPGANASSYVTPPVTPADSGAQFRVIVTNAFGAVTSAWATLTVNPANTLTWTGAVSSDWNNPTNWSPQTVPTASDRVVINSGNVIIPAGATFGVLDFTGVNVTGTLNVRGTMNWTGGSMQAALTVSADAVLNISGDGVKLLGGVITNAGTLNWLDGDISSSGTTTDDATIHNLAGGLASIQSDATFSWGNQWATQPRFNNAGTVRKSGGSGMTIFERVRFQNTGTLEVQSGTLSFNSSDFNNDGTSRVFSGTTLTLGGGGTSGGTFDVASGGAVHLTGGGFIFISGLSLSGPGFFGVSGSIALYGVTALPNFDLIGGGSVHGDFTNTGTMNWTGGSMQAALTVSAGAVLNISGDGVKLLGGVITNAGTLNWLDGDISSSGTTTDDAAIYNLASGLASIQSDAMLSWGNQWATQPRFNNAGTVRKSGGSGMTLFERVPFHNIGTLEVQSGMLRFGEGLTSSGTVHTEAGAVTELIGGRSVLSPGAVFTGSGAVRLAGGLYGTLVGERFQVIGGWVSGAFTNTGSLA